MKHTNDLNKIKESIVAFALSQKITLKELHEEWQGPYRSNWNNILDKDLQFLCDEMLLFKKAMVENDRVTQLAALVVARSFAMNLQNFFLYLFEDIERMVLSEKFKWPKIPEDYKVPDHYNHPRDH